MLVAQWNKVAQECGFHYSFMLPTRSGSQQRYAKWPDYRAGEEAAWPLRTAGILRNSRNTRGSWDTFLIDTPFHYSRCACLHLQHSSCPHVTWWPARFYFCFSYIQFIWNYVSDPSNFEYSAPSFPNDHYSMLSSFLPQIHHPLPSKYPPWAYPECSCWNHLLLCIPLTALAFLLAPHCPHILSKSCLCRQSQLPQVHVESDISFLILFPLSGNGDSFDVSFVPLTFPLLCLSM